MTLLICSNNSKKNNRSAIEKAVSILRKAGCRCVADDEPQNHGIEGLELFAPAVCEEICDAMVSVGGDGTMLRSAQRAVACDKSIFGINAGRLGFLCAFDLKQPETITAEAIAALDVTPRSLLEISCSDDPSRIFTAVNDLVLSKGALSKTIGLSVESSEKQIGVYRCDGVIVSTPTGSTAYSLSAGGPILDPSLDLMLLTPICAHSFFSSSIVLGGESELTITPTPDNDNDVYVSVDSFCAFRLPEGVSVKVKRSSKTLKLLTSHSRDFYGVLRSRIAEGG